MEKSLKILLFNKVPSVDLGPRLPCYHPFGGGKRTKASNGPHTASAGAQFPDNLSSLGFSELGFS